MAQPVLVKQTFLIVLMTGLQAVVPALVAVASLYATIILFGNIFDPSSAAVVIVASVAPDTIALRTPSRAAPSIVFFTKK